MISDETMNFKVERDKNNKTKEILKEVYDALSEKGYNPINQIVGYILSGDPTYITSHKNARNIIRTLERDEGQYSIDTIVVGMPINMDGSKSFRVDITEKFIHKLKCKFNKILIETVDERLTTVQAHRTMNELGVKSKNKKNIVDTISAVYILETFINKK